MLEKLKILSVIYIFAGAFALRSVFPMDESLEQSPVAIMVDCAQEKGPLPKVFTPSINLGGRGPGSPTELADKELLDTFGREIGFSGTYRIFLFLDRLIHREIAYEDFAPYLEKIKRENGTVIISLIRLPEELVRPDFDQIDPYSGQRDRNRAYFSPPKDFAQWQEIVYRIMRLFSVDNKFDNILYEIWNEPDHGGYWTGTEEEYFKMYQYAVYAARKLEKEFNINIKIGGPATMSWNGYRISQEAKKNELEKSMMYKFIRHAKENNLDIDFISWHQYTNNVKYHQRNNVIPNIRGWLQQYGFNANIPLIIDEWNLWLPNRGDSIIERDGEMGASYALAHIYNMDKAGLDAQTFFALQDFDIENYPGNSGLGLFTLYGIKKTSYNVFFMLKKLGKTRLATTISDDNYVCAFASHDGNKITILINNYVNPDTSDLSPGIDYLENQRFTEQSLWSSGITSGEMLSRVITKGDIIEGLKVSDKVKNDLRTAHSLYSNRLRMSKTPVRVELIVKNLPFRGKIKYRRYLIDSTHGNNLKESSNLITQAKTEALEEIKTALRKRGRNEMAIPIIDKASSDDETLKQEAKQQFISLPEEIKHEIASFVEDYKRDYSEKLYRKAREATTSRILEFESSKVGEGRYPQKGVFEQEFFQEPFSVSLIVIEPA